MKPFSNKSRPLRGNERSPLTLTLSLRERFPRNENARVGTPERRENIERPTSNTERRSERGSALPFDVRRWMFDVGCSSGFRGREQLSTGLGRPTAAVQFLKVFPSHESRSSRREAHDSKSEIRNPKSEIDESLLSSAATVQGFDSRTIRLGSSLPRGKGRGGKIQTARCFHRTPLRTLARHGGILPLFISSLLLFINPALHAQSNADADPLPALVQILRDSSEPQMQLDILRGLSAAFKGRRQVPMPKGWGTVETKLSQSPNADVRTLTQSLSLTFGSAQALAALRKILADPGANLNARRTALDSLLGAKDSGLTEILLGLLKDPDLRGAAIRGLAAYNDPKTPEAILTVFSSFDGAEKRDALNTLASRVAFAKPMLSAVSEGKIPRNALTAEMKDGRSITGLVKQQDDKSVTLITQNETLTLPRNEIQSLQQSELSMMPEGLLAPLADQEARDLLYYLSRPGQVPLPGEPKGN